MLVIYTEKNVKCICIIKLNYNNSTFTDDKFYTYIEVIEHKSYKLI